MGRSSALECTRAGLIRKGEHLATATPSESCLDIQCLWGRGSLPVGLGRKAWGWGVKVDLDALGDGRYSRFRDQVRKLSMCVFLGKGSVFH